MRDSTVVIVRAHVPVGPGYLPVILVGAALQVVWVIRGRA